MIDEFVNSEDFETLTPVQKARSRKVLFNHWLDKEEGRRAQFEGANSEQQAEVQQNFIDTLQKKYPDQFSTKGFRLVKHGNGTFSTGRPFVPIRDIKTELFIEDLEQLVELTQPVRQPGSLFTPVSEKESAAKRTKDVRDALSQIPEDQRIAIAPLVNERISLPDSIQNLFPTNTTGERTAFQKVGDFVIPGITRAAPPIAAYILTRGDVKKTASFGAAGEWAAQRIENYRGIRDGTSPTEIAIGAFTSVIPAIKGSQATNGMVRTATNSLIRGGEGAAIAGGSEAVRQLADEGTIDLKRTGLAAGLGLSLGATMGAAEARVLGSRLGVKPDSIEGKTIDQVSDMVAQDVVTTQPKPKPVVNKTSRSVASAPGDKKQRGFSQTLQESEFTRPELKNLVEDYYNPLGNEAVRARAVSLVDEDPAKAMRQVLSPDSKADADTVSVALELINRAQKAGNFDEAASIALDVTRKATSQGQAIQTLSVWNRLTPTGALRAATSVKGGKLTGPEVKQIKDLAEDVQRATSDTEKIIKAAQLETTINSLEGSTFLEKMALARKMAMLLNVKTQARNIGGNTFLVGLETASEAIEAPIDKFVSVFTGKRTRTTPSIRAKASGLSAVGHELREAYRISLPEGQRGLRANLKALRGAFEHTATLGRLTAQNKFDLNTIRDLNKRTFSSKAGRMLEDTLSVSLGVPDRIAWWSAFRSSIDNQKRVSALNGAPMATPTKEMIDQAYMDAARAIFQDDNGASKLFSGMRRVLNVGKSTGFGEVILPFTQVPGSILMRGLEYSPLGFAPFVRQLYRGVAPVLTKQQFNQKEFVEAFSRASIGTGGLLGSGYLLHKLGVITGLPEEDFNVENLRRSLGMGGYQINVSALKEIMMTGNFQPRKPRAGDVMVNYDWVQPAAIPMAMGAQLSEEEDIEKRGNKIQDIAPSLMAGIKTLEEQPLVSGLMSFFRAAGNKSVPEAIVGSIVQDLPASFIPTIAKQVEDFRANQIVETKGSTGMETAYQRILARIPFVAEKLGYPPRRDIYGDAIERYDIPNSKALHAFNVFANPAFIRRIKDDPVGREILDLYQRTGEPGMVPKRRSSFMVNGEKYNPTAQERSDMAIFEGRLVEQIYSKLVLSPGWNKLPDEIKVKLMSGYLVDIHKAAKIELLGDRPKKGSGRLASVLLGGRELAERELQTQESQ